MLNHFKIGSRLAGAFLALILLLLGVAYAGWSATGKMFALTVDMYDDSIVPMGHIADVQYLASRNRILVMDMLINRFARWEMAAVVSVVLMAITLTLYAIYQWLRERYQ